MLIGYLLYLPLGDQFPVIKGISYYSLCLSKFLRRPFFTELCARVHPISKTPNMNSLLTGSLPNLTNGSISTYTYDEHVGCPSKYVWCFNTPRLRIAQLVIATSLNAIGYPIGLVLASSLYSKILGDNKKVPHVNDTLTSAIEQKGYRSPILLSYDVTMFMGHVISFLSVK